MGFLGLVGCLVGEGLLVINLRLGQLDFVRLFEAIQP